MEQRSATHAQRSQCNNFLFIIPRHMPRSKAHKSRREFRCCAGSCHFCDVLPPTIHRTEHCRHHTFKFPWCWCPVCHPFLACFAVSVAGVLRCSLLDREKAFACSSVRPARPLSVAFLGPGQWQRVALRRHAPKFSRPSCAAFDVNFVFCSKGERNV